MTALQLLSTIGPDPAAPAWPGLREFRVLRREFEDALRTQRSFHRVSMDGVALPPFPAEFPSHP